MMIYVLRAFSFFLSERTSGVSPVIFILDFVFHDVFYDISFVFSVTTVSPRRSTGVAGTQLTAALNVSKTTGTGKPLQLAIAIAFVFCVCICIFVFGHWYFVLN